MTDKIICSWIVFYCGIVLFCACGGSQAHRVESQGQIALPKVTGTKVYTMQGDDVRITLLELEGEEVLIYFQVSRTPFNNKVIKHKGEKVHQGYAYVTQYHGRPYHTLTREENPTSTRYRLHVPERTVRDLYLTYDKEESATVDPRPILDRYAQQVASGELETLSHYNREVEQQGVLEHLEAMRENVMAACDAAPKMTVNWSTIDEATIKRYSISGYCGKVYSAMKDLCRFQSAKKIFKSINRITCKMGPAFDLHLDGQTLESMISVKEAGLLKKVKQTLEMLKDSSGNTLGQLIIHEQTDICSSKKGKHVIIFAPTGARHPGLSYGDGKTFFHIGAQRWLSSGWFFDPRQFNKTNNASFRGYDLRYYSRVDVDREKSTCEVVCGTRTTALELTPRDQVVKILKHATYKKRPHDREPYALARDQRGIYYYVDRSKEELRKKDFRVYIGPRGRLKRKKMKDIVSDSEGEIFSTHSGRLRLLMSKSEAVWIVGKKQRKLQLLPIRENWGMIYNGLGVYFGLRLGVPCDDF